MKNKTKLESIKTLLKDAKTRVDIARRKGCDDIEELMQEVIMLTEVYRIRTGQSKGVNKLV